MTIRIRPLTPEEEQAARDNEPRYHIVISGDGALRRPSYDDAFAERIKKALEQKDCEARQPRQPCNRRNQATHATWQPFWRKPKRAARYQVRTFSGVIGLHWHSRRWWLIRGSVDENWIEYSGVILAWRSYASSRIKPWTR